MADFALVAARPVVDMAVKKLGSGLLKELGLGRSIRIDVEKLRSVLSTIKAVLDDAERRSITERAVSDWLTKLRHAALDVEDVVEEFEAEELRRRMEGFDRMTGKVRDFFSSNNPISFRHKMARKIKEIGGRLNDIAEERLKFHFAGGSVSEKAVDRETFSFVIETEVYGRDDDREEVVDFLVNPDNSEDLSVLPIVGLGGVGKTTLAQLVYNDERLKERFDHKCWVCVSENFDVIGIIRAIVECITKTKSDLSTVEAVQLELQKILSGKSFLLVLDDVWNESDAEWEKLKTLLRIGKRSKIITTTRSDIVARIMGTVIPKKLQGLHVGDCWTLFKQRAYRFQREEENPKLVEIGKQIVENCGGLPLAAKALGSLMSSKREEAEWLAIRDNEIWKLSLDEITILPILKLSYDHLPSHLKRCFTYCSIFPKDHIFEIKKLIQLWIAEGLIDASFTSLCEEDIGSQYFNNLLWRSFFQDFRMDDHNNMDTCKMHDLVHDLACSLTKDESLALKTGKENIPHGCRYLSVICDYRLSTSLKTICQTKKLRSLVLFGQTNIDMDEFIFNVTKNFTQLRALDLSCCCIERLSDKTNKLKHLRLLELSYTDITVLPISITRLYNLQTLNLKYCCRLRELPEGIANLTNLKHIDVSGCWNLTCVPHGLGQLSNLQTLSMFIVAQENRRGIIELQHLNSIQGSLVISDLHHVKDLNEAMQANLRAKTRLNFLMLAWNNGSVKTQEPLSTDVMVEVLERLQPPHNLKELVIYGYTGIKLPSWMTRAEVVSASLRNIVKLTLFGNKKCEYLPPLGQLPSLKHLIVNGMHAVRRIGEEFYGDDGSAFPSLEYLDLYDMPNLEEWDIEPRTIERKVATFPCLKVLQIESCPKLIVQPCIPCSVEDLTIRDSNEMLLSAESLAGLSKLERLIIAKCGVSSSSSSKWWDGLQHLTTLENLYIHGCHELTCLPEGIMYLHSLHLLHLFSNTNLRSLELDGRKQQQPIAFFPALRSLHIERAFELTTLPEWVVGLTSLQKLTIWGCPELKMLPNSVQHLTALQELSIYKCPNLEKAWQEGDK